MAKKQLYFAECERLYVIEQQTLAEIESRHKISARTLQDWKTEGDWELKRKNYLRVQSNTQQEMAVLLNKLVKATSDDLEAGREVPSGRLYTIAKLAPIVQQKVHDHYAGTTTPDPDTGDTGTPSLNEEAKEQIRILFGLK